MLQEKLTWLTAILEHIIFAGAFFGWANIYPVLKDESYFTESCPLQANETTETNTTVSCTTQEESLSLVFTISSSFGILSSILLGTLFDLTGGWVTRTILINTSVLSYIIIASSNPASSYLLYIAFPLVQATGFGVLLMNTQHANLFAKWRGMYSISVTGAFNSSSVLYLFVNKLYYMGFNFHHILYLYAGLYFITNLRTFTLTPRVSVPFSVPINYEYGYKELRCSDGTKPQDPNPASEVGDSIDPDKSTFKDCLRQVYFYTGATQLVILQFVTTFYISTLNMFLEGVLPSKDDVGFYINIFAVLQCCGFLFALPNGFLIQYLRRRFCATNDDYYASIQAFTVGFFLAGFCLIAMSISTLIPVASVQIFCMLMQVSARLWFYGVFNAFCTLVFPSKHYGKVFGLFSCINGLFLLLQYPLTLMLTRVLNHNFTVLNSGLLVLSCVSLIHPIYLVRYIRRNTVRGSTRAIEVDVHNSTNNSGYSNNFFLAL